jgi:hypothetical protein
MGEMSDFRHTLAIQLNAPASFSAKCLIARGRSLARISQKGLATRIVTLPELAMKLLTALIVLFACLIGLVVLTPLVLAVVLPLGWLVIWLLPMIIIACSDKTTGGEKLAWILAMIFLSWFAWIFYFLLAPLKPRREHRRWPEYGRYRYD